MRTGGLGGFLSPVDSMETRDRLLCPGNTWKTWDKKGLLLRETSGVPEEEESRWMEGWTTAFVRVHFIFYGSVSSSGLLVRHLVLQ